MKAFVMEEWRIELVNEIIEVAREFIEETAFPVTFDRSKVYDRLRDAFFSPEGGIVLAVSDEGKIAGGAILYACADYQVEKFGYMEKFFVRPSFRSQGVGRKIAKRCAEWFDEQDCLFSFATSTANIGATGLFTNLMAKFGYQSIGPTLTRKYHGKV